MIAQASRPVPLVVRRLTLIGAAWWGLGIGSCGARPNPPYPWSTPRGIREICVEFDVESQPIEPTAHPSSE